jgi:putative membrane protein
MNGPWSPATLLAHAARGVAIGAANTVPGVSGGTIAVVTGVYDQLVDAIGNLFSGEWQRRLAILVPVFAGALVGIAAFAWVIDWGLSNYPEQTFFFFVGLIAGSVPFIAGELRGNPVRAHHILLALAAVGILLAQALLGEPPLTDAIAVVDAGTFVPLLAAGAVATATMIIPGVSGSFVLLVIGMYATFLQAVRTANLAVLGVLAAGAIAGLVAVSKLMSILLTRFRIATYWVILGLVIGSIVGVWPGISSWGAFLADVVALAVGCVAAVALGKRPADSGVSGR